MRYWIILTFALSQVFGANITTSEFISSISCYDKDNPNQTLAIIERFFSQPRHPVFAPKQKKSPRLFSLERVHFPSFHLTELSNSEQRIADIESLDLLFSMAKTKQALKKYEEAIEYYQKNLLRETDPEKKWTSLYMLGECYEKLDNWDQALFWYLESFQANPNRGDPLKKISVHYRLQGWNDVAYLFAKFGSELPADSGGSLNHYDFDEEISITAYYTQFKEDGFRIASNLVLKKNIPQLLRDQTYRNLLFYVQPLEGIHFLPIEIDLPLLKDDIRWKPMNPSIRKTEDGYEAICRSVNYIQKGAREFHSFDELGLFRSRNFLLQYTHDFQLLSQHEIIEDLPRERIGYPMVQGLEDCRLFEFGQSTWFSCTTTDTNPTGSFQISLCCLGGEVANYRFVEDLTPLKGPDPYRCEKNWLPFVKDEKLHFVYSYNPFIIYQPDLETGECKTALHYEPTQDFSPFRGSAGPLPFEDGYLILEHEVAFNDAGRNYLHRFLFLDKDFQIIEVSKPFIFRHFGVEFCCSMCWDHSEKNVVLAVGIEDCEAYFCTIDKQTILSLLRPL